MRDAFSSDLFKLAKKNKNVMLLTADLGFGVFDKFASSFPKQYINVGVAEQNMIGIATGLGLEGKKVFAYSIGNFSTMRCLEQIRNDAAYHDIDLTIVCSGGGFTYGSLGMSHHATEDIAVMRSMPNIKVIAPANAWESSCATKLLGKSRGISYLRIEKGGIKDYPLKGSKFRIGKSIYYKKGSDVSIISTGGIIEEAIKASKILEKENISCSIISMHTIKPIDKKVIISEARKTKKIITIEEHNAHGGLGGAVAEVLAKENIDCKFDTVSIKDKFSAIVGDQNYLRKIYKIDSKSISNKVIKSLFLEN